MVEEIDEKSLREKCKEYMVIRTNLLEPAVSMIRKELKNEYQVEIIEDEIRIHYFQEGERINRLLANNAIYASVIAQHKMDLEEYFLASMEGRKYA